MTDVPRVHVVTDDSVLARPDLVSVAAGLSSLDIALHLRARNMPGKRMSALVREIQRLRTRGPAIMINDRVDVAVATAAEGVHLPARGLPVARVREEFGNELLIGRSTHSPQEPREACSVGADFAFLGPIWPTTSHPERKPLGLDAIREAAPARIIAIGGINRERAAQCMAAGAYGVAVLSTVWDNEDPVAETLDILSIINRS